MKKLIIIAILLISGLAYFVSAKEEPVKEPKMKYEDFKKLPELIKEKSKKCKDKGFKIEGKIDIDKLLKMSC